MSVYQTISDPPLVARANQMARKLADFRMSISTQGRSAGEQYWSFRRSRGILTAEVETHFAGKLPRLQKMQVSHMNASTLASLHFYEGDLGLQPSFETFCDQQQGIICLRQKRDEARIPLTSAYHDPISMLLWLRVLSQPSDQPDQLPVIAKLRLTGGLVYAQHLDQQEVLGVLCDVYLLRPGSAYVYIDVSEKRQIVRLVQRCEFGVIEAKLDERSLRKLGFKRG